MQAAVSQAVEVGVKIKRKQQSQSRSTVVRETAAPIELVREIVPMSFADLQLVDTSATEITPRERSEALGRAVNVVVAAVAMVLLLPLMVLVAIAIKLTSSGPVFYSQTRVGLDRRHRRRSQDERRSYDHGGKLFKMYKFRTMRVDAEIDGCAVWAQKSDPRVTAIGSFLRRARIDELPQLYNVLRGEMNIVGPRPERPTIFARLRDDIPDYRMRQRVKPGITGWAQVKGLRGNTDLGERIRADLFYLENWNLLLDFQIMAMTFLRRDNAY